MRKPGVKMTYDRVPQVQAMMEGLSASRVLVGIPADDAARKPEPGEKVDINNATIAYIMENGSAAANIPARPFLIPGVSDARDRIAGIFRSGLQKVAAGLDPDIDRTLHRVGLVAQASVRNKINTGPLAPLAPATLRARRRRGRTGEKPLIDTGQLKNAVNYVVARGDDDAAT